MYNSSKVRIVINYTYGSTHTTYPMSPEDAERYEEVFLWSDDDISSWYMVEGTYVVIADTTPVVPF